MSAGEREVTIRELLRGGAASFTPAERKLARALLASYPTSGLEPLARLATRAGVSSPTALRLVSKLGFDGYPAFQRQLRHEIQLRIDSPLARYRSAPAGSRQGTLPAEFGPLLANIRTTADSVDPYEFSATIDLLADLRRRVVVTGGVVSRALASHLVHRLSQLRPRVTLAPAATPALFTQVVDLHRSDIVLAFDYKRYQWDTNEFLRKASGKKVTIVLCTDTFHMCPALEVAAHVLTFSVDGPPPFDSPIGGFALVEALSSCLAGRLGDAGRARIASLEAEDSGWMWDRTLLQADAELVPSDDIVVYPGQDLAASHKPVTVVVVTPAPGSLLPERSTNTNPSGAIQDQ
jgi:DNA-binding MurR/RpiR family transcriptional regulator